MPSILPGLVDRQRVRKNGTYWVGEVIYFGGNDRKVVAHVYGDTIKECRARKRAVADLLQRELKKGGA